MKLQLCTKNRGYIAVVSAIILSTILTAYAFASGMNSFWARHDQLTQENYVHSKTLAESCGYEALYQYTTNKSAIETPKQFQVDPQAVQGICTIDTIFPTTTTVSITTHAVVEQVYAGMQIFASTSLSSGTLTITSWRNITSIPP